MKKDFFNLKKSKLLLLMLFALLAGGVSPAWADEITVNNADDLNEYIPLYGYYADTNNNTSEFVIPASVLSSLQGGTISGLKFYSNVESQSWGSAVYQVYVTEVGNTTLSAYVGYANATVVYEGSLSISSNQLVVNFTTPFEYGDGNLLIGTRVKTSGTCSSSGAVKFYGNANAGSGVSRYKGYSETASSFLPKVTIAYTPGVGFVAKPTGVTVSNVTTSAATISWTAGGSETEWEISCSTSSSEPAVDGSYTTVSTNPSYNATGLTSGTTYYVYVRAVNGENKSKWSTVCSFTPGVLTINNVSTTTNTFVPIYGYDMDSYKVKSQFVIPSSSLASISGTHINKMVFYGTDSRNVLSSNTFDIYMKEVADATISSLTDWALLEKVYSGSLSVSGGEMTITLPDGFDYSDGNLLIGFIQTAGTSWTNLTWTGIEATGSSLSGSSSVSQKNFLPQMSIYYAQQTDAAKMKVTAEAAYDFGFLTATSENNTATFTIENKGNAALTDANVSYSGDAAISLSATGTLASIAAKSSTEITITVNTETPGIYAGTITITGTGSEDVEIPVKAIVRNTDKLFVDFDENNPKPATWTMESGWSVNANGYATIGSSAASIITNEIQSAGEDLTLRLRGNNAANTLTVSYSTTAVDGEYTQSGETVSELSTDAWQIATFTIPADAKFVKITGQYVDLDAVYGLQAAAMPVMVLSTTALDFGLVSDADAQALTLTIRNEGGAALTNVSAKVEGLIITDGEGNELNSPNIAAGQSLTLKVKMANKGSFEGFITVAANDVPDQTVNVSGYMLDDTKIIETFASLPDNWTQSSTLTYNSTSGVKFPSTARTLTTPKIVVGDGESLVINAKLSYSSGYITITGSTDGTNYNAFDAKTYNYSTGLNTSDYTLVTIDDIPAGTYNLRIQGSDVYVNVFNGFSYAPSLALYSNEECTTPVAAEVDKNFGFITEAQQQKYYIKNIGGGQIDLTVNTPSGFTAAIDDAALTANEKATLTITMPNTPEGLHNSSVVVTAKNHANDTELGTFTVNLNGAVIGSKNDINIVGNELSEMPAGWDRGNWSMSASTYVYNNSSTSYDMTSQIFTVAEGETMLIEAKGVNNYYDASLSYSFKVGDADWTTPVAITGISRSDWKVFELTGASEGSVKVKFTGAYVGIRRFYGFEEASVPVMGFAAEGTTKDFGMITAKTTSDAYTITNSGTAALNGLSVACNNDNFEIAVADNATSIAAGGSVTFTVALKTTALGSQSGTVTIAGTGVESKTFTVKGYVADGTKIFTTFASLPDRWENSGWTFNASTGAYSSSSSNTLTSPKIIVTEGQKLAISAKINSNSTYNYVTVKGSSDNGATFEAYTKQLTYDALNKDDYTVVELDDIPTTVNKIQLIGYYVYVNGLNGFTYNDNDPEFSMFSDSECNTPIAGTTATNNWGFVSEDKTATYYIKNTGTGTLSLSKSETPAGFTAELGATSLAAGKSTTLTISMANDAENNEGYHGGDVVLTGKNSSDETLGTFTVTSSGVVVGSKTDINFTSLDAFPAGWEATNWSVTSGVAKANSYSAGTLLTGTYTVAAGEKLVIEGKGNSNSSWSSPSLTYRYSTDGGSSWTTGKSTLTYTYSASDYQLQVIDDIPAGNAKIEFTGSYMDIRRIYGYTAVLEPVMTLSPAATSYDFQMQTAAADYVITVTNTGTADMTNLAAALTGDDKDDFEVAVSKTTVPYTGENTATVTVTLKASTEYKTHNATLTISADDLADKVITLTGKTRDASKWYVDFASEIPSSFVEKGSWTVSSGAARTTSSTENSLITQPINLAAGEKIYFDAYNPYSGSLKVRYSVNGGISWSDYVDYTAAINTSGSFSSHEIDLQNASAVTAVIEFKGRYYIQLDNVYGGTLNNTASMIKVTKSAEIVENGVTEPFGSISTQATATYTITNVGNGTLTITSPVATTGVATAAVNATSLGNGESATLTITMPVAAPYEYKEGAVTVETSLGNFVINYNATILNPNALDEQFASDKPAGWYFGGYWEVNSQRAENTASGVADLITEQLAVAGTSDVLTFQVAKTGSSAPTFKVYTSQDRVEWTEQTVTVPTSTSYEDVNISGLAAGDYYVKISGARIKVDNFLGWEKKNNTRDLYVTATTFPATTAKGNTATVTATVTSLIAKETGVYAKLFVDGEDDAVLTAEAQDIDLDASKTFSFSYEIPENKTAQIKVFFSDHAVAFATAENDMKVSYSMSETVDPETITAGTFEVSLTRTFAADSWNTVCLPVAVASVADTFGENAAAYQFTGFNDQTLSFSKVRALEAGTPYIIYVENAISSLSFTNAKVVATAGNVTQGTATFQGTYAPIADMSGKYGVTSKNTIAKGKSGSSIKGFRAYFEGDNLSNARINAIDESTGISRVFAADEVLGDQRVYNLNGQHVENAKKGIYIVNGKKVVIK